MRIEDRRVPETLAGDLVFGSKVPIPFENRESTFENIYGSAESRCFASL